MGDGGAHFGSKLKMEEAHLSCKWEIEGHTGVVSGRKNGTLGWQVEIEGHTGVVSERSRGTLGL